MSLIVPIEIHANDEWIRDLPVIKLNPKVPLVTLEKAIIAHLTKSASSLKIQSLVENFDLYSAACETSLHPTRAVRPTKHAFSKTLHEMGFEEDDNGHQKKEHKLMLIETDALGATDNFDFMHEKTPTIVHRSSKSRKRSILKVSDNASPTPPTRRDRHVSFCGNSAEEKDADNETFHVEKAGVACGALITNIDLRQPLNLEAIRDLRRELIRNKVLVIRQQDSTPLAETQLITFTKYFGTPVDHLPGQCSPDHAEVRYVSSKDSESAAYDDWQSDLSYRKFPAEFSIASVDHIASSDTVHALFSDGHKAYMALPSSERLKLNEQKCVYKHEDESRNDPDDQPVTHPLVIIHPETSRPSLFVRPTRTVSIQGMSEADSTSSLKRLIEHQANDRFVFKHTLQQGDVLVWDNRAVLYRLHSFFEYSAEERLLKQTVTECDAAPVGLIEE